MKILNLYAGIGGNRKLWEGHDVTAVESEQYIADVYAALYPEDTLIVGDAHQYLLDHFQEFDFIWSSPPCPTHSKMRTVRSGYGEYCFPDMKLYEEIIFLKHFYKGEWCVENVTSYYKPLIEPTAVIERHYVWTSKYIWSHRFDSQRKNLSFHTKEDLSDSHGINLPEGTKNQRKLLRNAVSPEFGKFIIDQLVPAEELEAA